jgi:hypothetical protein
MYGKLVGRGERTVISFCLCFRSDEPCHRRGDLFWHNSAERGLAHAEL